MGQKRLSGKANNSIVSVPPPFVFGFLIFIVIWLFEWIFTSSQVHEEEGSKEFGFLVRISLALKEPKYPKQIDAQITFLLCFFHFLLSIIFLILTRISKTRGSFGTPRVLRFSDLSMPHTKNFAVSIEFFFLSKPIIFEMV